MSEQKISAVLITYNEADIISNTLKKLTWCDEIIVVDSFSTDNTTAICEQFGCKVYQKKFEGFGKQKRYAVSLTKNDWVLNLDADEVLTEALINEIQTEMKQPVTDGYKLPRQLVFLGTRFKFGKEKRQYCLRLFNKTIANFNNKKVHEEVETTGSPKKLKGYMLHYSYKNLQHYFTKFNQYTSAVAESDLKKGKNKPAFLIVLTIPFNFFIYYIVHLNILNGFSGFCWARLSAFYHFTKYIKTRELLQGKKQKNES